MATIPNLSIELSVTGANAWSTCSDEEVSTCQSTFLVTSPASPWAPFGSQGKNLPTPAYTDRQRTVSGERNSKAQVRLLSMVAMKMTKTTAYGSEGWGFESLRARSRNTSLHQDFLPLGG